MSKGKIILYCGVLILLISLNSCKKEYPKDIPDWLKEWIDDEIKATKKGTSFCSTGGYCWVIKEYNNNDETIYERYNGAGAFFYWDFQGNIICEPIEGSCLACTEEDICGKQYIRTIWIQSQ